VKESCFHKAIDSKETQLKTELKIRKDPSRIADATRLNRECFILVVKQREYSNETAITIEVSSQPAESKRKSISASVRSKLQPDGG